MPLFQPEVERFIKYVGAGAVIGTFLLPLEWGYHQRQEARTWRETACAYRLRDLARLPDPAGRTAAIVRPPRAEDSCTTLRRLGVDVDSWQAAQTSAQHSARRR